MSNLEAGWYPDQSDPSSERYWDGAAWTTRTRALRDDSRDGESSRHGEDRADSPTEVGESALRFYPERLGCGTAGGAGCLTLVVLSGAIWMLEAVGINPHGSVWSVVGWTVGIVVFVGLFILKLTVAPEETNCPRCGKRFRPKYNTCRQCGYTKP